MWRCSVDVGQFLTVLRPAGAARAEQRFKIIERNIQADLRDPVSRGGLYRGEAPENATAIDRSKSEKM